MSGKYIEEDKTITCSVSNDCGGCCYTKVPYDKTLSLKQKHVTELFRGVAECEKITGMYRPVCYRNKVHAAVGTNRDGRIITGTYKEGTHKIIPVDGCMIEDAQSENILKELRRLFQSFKYQPYNEDTKRGLERFLLLAYMFIALPLYDCAHFLLSFYAFVLLFEERRFKIFSKVSIQMIILVFQFILLGNIVITNFKEEAIY